MQKEYTVISPVNLKTGNPTNGTIQLQDRLDGEYEVESFSTTYSPFSIVTGINDQVYVSGDLSPGGPTLVTFPSGNFDPNDTALLLQDFVNLALSSGNLRAYYTVAYDTMTTYVNAIGVT